MRQPTERQVLGLVDAFRGYAYGTLAAGYPWAIPGVRVPLVSAGAPRMTNCVTFLEALLCRAFDLGAGEWDADMHAAMMITRGDRFGPVHAAIEAGLADPLMDADWPGNWRLCQGWRPDGGGHAFIVARTEPDGSCLILEANRAHGLDGVGYRDLGPRWGLGEALLPAAPASWTWARLRRVYPVMRACALRVAASE